MTLGSFEPPPPAPPAEPAVQPKPEPEPEPPQQAAIPKPPVKPARKPVREAKQEPSRSLRPAPAINPKTLIGLDQASVRRLLGPPQRVASDHLSLSWIYHARGCSVQLVFYPSLENASFHVLKFSGSNSDGHPLDASDACVNHILLARSDASH